MNTYNMPTMPVKQLFSLMERKILFSSKETKIMNE